MGTLFATTVASAKPAEKDYKLSDDAGLYLLVRPNGSKLWRFNYVHHGKHRTLAFSAWPDIGLADARGRRDEARRLVAAGLDPSHEEKVAREGPGRGERYVQDGRAGMDRQERTREHGGDHTRQDPLAARYGLPEDRQSADRQDHYP
jgi:hypothetical protein